jgi:DNA invertase Pin-like site-specific DNA recombinase
LNRESPNGEPWITGFGDGQRHPSSGPRGLGDAVGAASGAVLEAARVYVLQCNSAEGAAVWRSLVFRSLIANVDHAAVDSVAQLGGDRLGRSLQDLCGFLSELHSLGIDLFLHQQGIDTTTPAGKAMFQMMGVFAEFERSMIRERVNAGIARAKAGGKHCGRPFIDTKLEGRIRDALAAPGRPGLHKIAKQFGVGTGTVQRIAHAN